MPTTVLPITVGQMFIICLFVLVVIYLMTKAKGIKGSWSQRSDIAPLLTFVTTPEDPEENKQDSKGERICRKFLEDTLGEQFAKCRPDFLRNPVTSRDKAAHNLEIDCYSPKLKLGVEYNGEQHYKFIPHFHKNYEAFRLQQYRDELKRRMCSDNNVTLIEVPYTVKNIPRYLFEKLEALGYFKINK